jgi:ferrous iron transport protein B
LIGLNLQLSDSFTVLIKGKSTFFNRITGGSNAYVGNWPGMTVSLMQAQIKIDNQLTEVVDLPGIYDLNGFSDDEAVVQRFLENYKMSYRKSRT